MSFRTTGILLAVLIVLGVGVYVYQSKQPSSAQSATDKSLELFNYSANAADINLLEVTQGNKTTRLVAAPDGLSWNLESPEKGPADMTRVSTVLGEITVLKAVSLVSQNPKDAAKYGLDKPDLTVSLGVKNKDFQKFFVGMEAPTKTGYYVRLADNNKIYLVDASVVQDLKQLVTNPPKATPTPAASGTAAPQAAPTP